MRGAVSTVGDTNVLVLKLGMWYVLNVADCSVGRGDSAKIEIEFRLR